MDNHQKPYNCRKGADEVRNNPPEARVVGVERVVRAKRENRTCCHKARADCEENGGRMSKLRENTSGAQCYNKRSAGA